MNMDPSCVHASISLRTLCQFRKMRDVNRDVTFLRLCEPGMRNRASPRLRGLVVPSVARFRAAFWRARATRPAHPTTADWRLWVTLAAVLDKNTCTGAQSHQRVMVRAQRALPTRPPTTQKLKS